MRTTSLIRISGSRRGPSAHGDAYSFALPRTRRISQFNGLDSPTGSSISPLPRRNILPKLDMFFISFRELQANTVAPYSPC